MIDDDDRYEGSLARGCLYGILFGLVMWALLIGAALGVLHLLDIWAASR
jgi:hypothetical protein